MRIKSITVGNFKNLATTKLDLHRMIAVVSTNNYGKSNLLEAIRFGFDFISHSAKGRNSMMRWVRGIPLSPTLAGKDYVFEIEFDDSSLGEYEFVRYAFKFSWFNDQNTGARISDEIIEMRPNESVRYTAYLKREKGLYRAGKEKTGFRKISLAKDVLAIDVLSSIDDIEIANVISKIKSLSYRMCNTLELDSSFRSAPLSFDFDDGSALPFDDDDIPNALSVLKRDYPDKYARFIETIYDLFPEFENVQLKAYALTSQDKSEVQAILTKFKNNAGQETEKIPYHIKDELYRLVIHSKYLNQAISMEHMSTGTKRIIWLVANAVFGSCYGTSLLCVDEIETSIHPKMIRNLLESMHELLDDGAMIVTSHSPYLVQYLKPEAIYVGLPNENGVAQFKKISKSKVKALVNVTRELETSVGEYLFELMAGDDDSASILTAYLED